MSTSSFKFYDFGAIFLTVCLAMLVGMDAAKSNGKIAKAKNNARVIWISIMSANCEREIHDLHLLWPGDLAEKDKTFKTAEDYFTYLLSNGTGNTIQKDPSHRIVSDLTPEMLLMKGLTYSATHAKVMPSGNAWHVATIGDGDEAETPFLLSRNIKASDIRYATEKELNDMDASPLLSFKQESLPAMGENGIWLTKGGSTYHAKKHLLNIGRVNRGEQPNNQPPLKIMPAADGYL